MKYYVFYSFVIFSSVQANLTLLEERNQCDQIEGGQILFEKVVHELNSSNLSSVHFFEYLHKSLAQCKNKEGSDAVYDMLKLFHNRCKRLEYVDAQQLTTFLGLLPEVMQSHMHPSYAKPLTFYDQTMFDRFTMSAKTDLIKDFSTRFEEFKIDPELFLDNIAQAMSKKVKEEVAIEQLRSTIVRFLEISLNKVIWSAHEPEKSWHSVKQISKKLVSLLEANIITEIDDLDDLLWSLVHRYCYFIDLTGTLLPNSFYTAVLQELDTQMLVIKAIDQEGDLLKTKVDFLKDSLCKGQRNREIQQDIRLS